jgi:hypothetical protein
MEDEIRMDLGEMTGGCGEDSGGSVETGGGLLLTR